MYSKLVSVVIPTYKRPTMLDRAIDSVLNQTYENIEVIVVDDNNPDTDYRKETETIMEKFKNEKKVKYIKHEHNKNGSAARNTGWKNSNGEYITFLDDDDVISSNRIELMAKLLDSLDQSWGMCYSAYELKKENGEVQKSFSKKFGNCYINALMRTFFMGSGSNLFLRKSVVDEIDGYDESFIRNQDIEFLVRATEKYKIAYIDEVLLKIYQEGNRKKRSFEEVELITKHYLDTFDEKINKLSKEDKNRVITVISLERFRTALYDKKIISGLKILIVNNVSFINFIKYILYLLKRVFTHESYGFYI